MTHQIEWRSAAPLWDVALQDAGDATRFTQPAILRFASDTFMEDLERMLAEDPARLSDLVLRAETWRSPASGWLAQDDPQRATTPRLFQPSHGRFYLVAASLVCRRPGLPDKAVDPGADEKLSFVLRRLVPSKPDTPVALEKPETYREYGWYLLPEGNRWREAPTPAGAEAAEERLPLFAITFDERGRKRRLLAGFIPVASRETYQAGPKDPLFAVPPDALKPDPNGPPDPLGDPRVEHFAERVTMALLSLRGELANPALDVEQARGVLLFALLDLAEYLGEHLPQVWQAVQDQAWTGADSAQQAIFQRLQAAQFKAGPNPRSWLAALGDAWAQREAILGLAATPATALPTNGLSLTEIGTAIDNLAPNTLNALVLTALSKLPPSNAATTGNQATGQASGLPAAPKIDPAAGEVYALRCLYERPRCRGANPLIASMLSPAFQLASFFDPDAPARPLRIAMPVDTSTEGLRKFPKNVAFLVSDQLRNQIERVQGIKLEQLDNGEINDEGGWTLGMICSLSIPIITICALFLLLIILFVLNIVFWWLPFFKICFPIILPAKKK